MRADIVSPCLVWRTSCRLVIGHILQVEYHLLWLDFGETEGMFIEWLVDAGDVLGYPSLRST